MVLGALGALTEVAENWSGTAWELRHTFLGRKRINLKVATSLRLIRFRAENASPRRLALLAQAVVVIRFRPKNVSTLSLLHTSLRLVRFWAENVSTLSLLQA